MGLTVPQVEPAALQAGMLLMLGAQPGQPSGVKHAHGEGPEPHLALLNCSCPRPENTVSPRYTSAHLHGAGVHGAGETGAQDAAHLHLHHAPTARPPFRLSLIHI